LDITRKHREMYYTHELHGNSLGVTQSANALAPELLLPIKRAVKTDAIFIHAFLSTKMQVRICLLVSGLAKGSH